MAPLLLMFSSLEIETQAPDIVRFRAHHIINLPLRYSDGTHDEEENDVKGQFFGVFCFVPNYYYCYTAVLCIVVYY